MSKLIDAVLKATGGDERSRPVNSYHLTKDHLLENLHCLPDVFLGHVDRPWQMLYEFLGPSTIRTSVILCASLCNRGDLVDGEKKKTFHKVRVNRWHYQTPDLVFIDLFVGVCENCNTLHVCQTPPPYKRHTDPFWGKRPRQR